MFPGFCLRTEARDAPRKSNLNNKSINIRSSPVCNTISRKHQRSLPLHWSNKYCIRIHYTIASQPFGKIKCRIHCETNQKPTQLINTQRRKDKDTGILNQIPYMSSIVIRKKNQIETEATIRANW